MEKKVNTKEQVKASIEELGQWLKDNANELAPNIELLKEINLRVTMNGFDIPEIEVEYSYLSEGIIKDMREWCMPK